MCLGGVFFVVFDVCFEGVVVVVCFVEVFLGFVVLGFLKLSFSVFFIVDRVVFVGFFVLVGFVILGCFMFVFIIFW